MIIRNNAHCKVSSQCEYWKPKTRISNFTSYSSLITRWDDWRTVAPILQNNWIHECFQLGVIRNLLLAKQVPAVETCIGSVTVFRQLNHISWSRDGRRRTEGARHHHSSRVRARIVLIVMVLVKAKQTIVHAGGREMDQRTIWPTLAVIYMYIYIYLSLVSAAWDLPRYV